MNGAPVRVKTLLHSYLERLPYGSLNIGFKSIVTTTSQDVPHSDFLLVGGSKTNCCGGSFYVFAVGGVSGGCVAGNGKFAIGFGQQCEESGVKRPIISDCLYDTNVQYSIKVTYGSGIASLYVSGELIANGTRGFSMSNTDSQGYAITMMNGCHDQDHEVMNGEISDVSIYSKNKHYVQSCMSNGTFVGLVPSCLSEAVDNPVISSEELDTTCHPNPCLNDGICIDRGDTYTCTCQTGYGGDDCQLELCTAPPLTPGYVTGACDGYVLSDDCIVSCEVCDDDGSATETCHSGVKYVGAPVLNCNPGDAFTLSGCVADKCALGTHTCDINAICSPTNDGEGSCSCNEGFSGDGHSCVSGHCDPNPCVNGGTCEPQDDSYRCVCPTGFAGDHCELPTCTAPDSSDGYIIHSCVGQVSSQDCSMSCGTCTEDNECETGVGYFGEPVLTCVSGQKFQVSGCAVDKCQNGANNCHINADCTPDNTPLGFTCMCKEGYSGNGVSCESENCIPNPCNGGTCNDDGTCTSCPSGYGGTFCDIPKCTSPTQEGYFVEDCTGPVIAEQCIVKCGTCNANDGCVEGVGYYGDVELTCETSSQPFQVSGCYEDQCTANTHNCGDNSQCVRSVGGGFTCVCNEGFTMTDNECVSVHCPSNNPCLNGGTCVGTATSYSCSCAEGYGGATCQ
jgi:hypothetical protein